MPNQWFVKRSEKGREQGPFRTRQLLELFESGQLKSHHLVRKNKDQKWRRASGLNLMPTTSANTANKSQNAQANRKDDSKFTSQSRHLVGRFAVPVISVCLALLVIVFLASALWSQFGYGDPESASLVESKKSANDRKFSAQRSSAIASDRDFSRTTEAVKTANVKSTVSVAEELSQANSDAATPIIPEEISEGITQVKDFVKTAREVKETYDDLKELLPSKPGASVDISKTSADFIVMSLSVATNKENRKSWDGGFGDSMHPDLQVVLLLTRNGNIYTYRTRKAKNTNYKTFNEKLVRIQEGDEIKIFVYDLDVTDDDLIGSYDKIVTDKMIAEKATTWSFDRVEAIEVKFEY